VFIGKNKKGAKGRRSAKTPPASSGKVDKKGKKPEKQVAKVSQPPKKKGKEVERSVTEAVEMSDSEAELINKEMVPQQKQAVIGMY